MKRITHLFLYLTILLTSCNKPDELDFLVVYSTQMYGNVVPWDFKKDTVNDVSLANFMSLVKEQRAIYGDRCIVLDVGNMHTRSLSNYYWRYIDTICEPLTYKAQRLIGYDAVALGHSDMRLMEPFTAQRHDTTACPPTLCANIFNKATGEHLFRPWICLERHGVRIAIFSLVDEYADYWTPALANPHAEPRNMIECMRDEIMTMRRQCNPDLVIGLVSSSRSPEELRLQEQIPGIDLAIGIELDIDHATQRERTHAGIVRIRMKRNAETGTYSKQRLKVTADLAQYEIDEEYAKAFSDDIARIREEYRREDGILPVDLITSWGIYSSHDFYRDLFHQAHLWYSHADVSFANIANPNQTITAGPVNISKIGDIFNHENMLVEFWMSGRELVTLLEQRYADQYNTLTSPHDQLLALRHDDKGHLMYNAQGQPYLNTPPSEFTSAAGIRYTVDLTKQPGHRITITEMLNGKTFHPDSIYTVATNSYIASKFEDEGNSLGWNKGEILSRMTDYSMPSIVHVIHKYFRECPNAYTPSEERCCNILPENWWREAKTREQDGLNPTW